MQKDKHPSSKVLAVFHIFSALPQFPVTSNSTPSAEYLNSLQQCTQQCACYLVHVLHPPYLLSKGKAVYAVKCFVRVLFWRIAYIFRFSVSNTKRGLLGKTLYSTAHGQSLDRQVESSLVCTNQSRQLVVSQFLGTVNNLVSTLYPSCLWCFYSTCFCWLNFLRHLLCFSWLFVRLGLLITTLAFTSLANF